MHRTFPGTIVLGTTVTLFGVAAATASVNAASISVNLPCQIESFPVTATLTGFTPNSTVSISGSGIFESVTADATGMATLPFVAPKVGTTDPETKLVTLTATDSAAVPLHAKTRFRSTNLAFKTTGGTRSPKTKRAWSFSGFVPGKPIYGHFRHARQTRANYRFGVAKGSCGQLSTSAPGIPAKGRIDTGRWVVQVDQKRVFNPFTKPRVTGSTTVFTTFK